MTTSNAAISRRQREQCQPCPRCHQPALTTHRKLTWCEACAYEPGDTLPAWKPFEMRVKPR